MVYAQHVQIHTQLWCSLGTNLSHQSGELSKCGPICWIAGPAFPHHTVELLRTVRRLWQAISLPLYTKQDLHMEQSMFFSDHCEQNRFSVKFRELPALHCH